MGMAPAGELAASNAPLALVLCMAVFVVCYLVLSVPDPAVRTAPQGERHDDRSPLPQVDQREELAA